MISRMLNAYIVIGICIFIAAACTMLPSALASAVAASPQTDSPSRIPAFHRASPATRLPATLDPSTFSDAFTRNTYAMAAKVKNVLYQQPCYCYCDQNNGHHSLYDCFVTAHASDCNICRYEAIFAYEQTRKGQTPAAIRNEIIRGDWRKIDPTPYETPKDIR